jgi:DNA polymerase-1
LDTETAKLPQWAEHPQAGLDPHLSRIRLLQIYSGAKTVYLFDLFALNPAVLAPLWRCRLVAHNAVFDLKHLRHAGIDARRVGCTMLMANALSGRLIGLARLVRDFLGWEISKQQRTSDWSTAELTPDQQTYAGLDAVAVFKLYHILKEELKTRSLARVYALMRDAQRAVVAMELNGIYFDRAAHAELVQRWQQDKQTAAGNLYQLLGSSVSPDSSKQLSDWLRTHLDAETLSGWPVTRTGQLRTGAQTLVRYLEHPLIKPLAAYKEAAKLISAFGAGFADFVNPQTGRIHAHFKLGGTATGRLSCFGPNIQNPPRDKAYRALFGAPAGRVLVVADYGQIELRVAALVSGDRNMLSAYARGLDLHRKTAAAVAGVPLSSVTAEQRQAAKAVNFGLLYGQGAEGLARYAKATYGVAMTKQDATRARDAFFNTYPGLRRWQQETARNAERTLMVATPGGRIRDFSKESGGYRYTEALNTPIQGGAAEVMLAALGRLEDHLCGIDAKLVNVIHDELVLEVSRSDASRARAAVEKTMVEGMLAIFPAAGTLNLVQAHVGANWAEAK